MGNPSSAPGSSSIAVFIEDSTDSLIISDNTIVSSDAQNGTDGVDGDDGVDGLNGENGVDVSASECNSLPVDALGGLNICGSNDVSGGDGGGFVCPEHNTIFPDRSGEPGSGVSFGLGGEGGCDGNVGLIGCGQCNIDVCYGVELFVSKLVI